MPRRKASWDCDQPDRHERLEAAPGACGRHEGSGAQACRLDRDGEDCGGGLRPDSHGGLAVAGAAEQQSADGSGGDSRQLRCAFPADARAGECLQMLSDGSGVDVRFPLAVGLEPGSPCRILAVRGSTVSASAAWACSWAGAPGVSGAGSVCACFVSASDL